MDTQASLKQLISYDLNTGVFRWAISRGFKAKGSICESPLYVFYKGKRYRKVDLAWLYVTGKRPPGKVKYRDNDSNNLKWDNLIVDLGVTPNKNHADIGCIVNDNSYHVFVIEQGVTADLGIYDNSDTALETVRKYLCSR